MTGQDRDYLPEDLVEWLKKEKEAEIQQEGDINVGEACKVWGCKRALARKMLDQLVEENKMIKLEGRLLNGSVGHFYRRID